MGCTDVTQRKEDKQTSNKSNMITAVRLRGTRPFPRENYWDSPPSDFAPGFERTWPQPQIWDLARLVRGEWGEVRRYREPGQWWWWEESPVRGHSGQPWSPTPGRRRRPWGWSWVSWETDWWQSPARCCWRSGSAPAAWRWRWEGRRWRRLLGPPYLEYSEFIKKFSYTQTC